MSVLKIKDGNNWVDIPAIKGADGTNGTNGVDGFSPTATVSKSGTTTTISITDKNGTTTSTINDGTNGTNGTNGQDGRDGYVQYTAGDNITINNNVISASGGGVVDLITSLKDDNNQNLTNFKKAKVGTYINDKGSSLYFVNKTAEGWTGNTQVDYVEAIYVVKDISNVTTPSSSIDFGYIVLWQYMEALKLFKLTVDTSGSISHTQMLTLPQVKGLTGSDQSISGEKTFYSIPKVNSYTVPTQNTQLVAKKYVDDKIGDINTILATLTTPSGGE